MRQKLKKESIPRLIHYCWFGEGSKNKTILKCISSWGKHLKGYKMVEWSEKNFDFSKAPPYVREALEAKKWAFVSDYVRLWAIYKYGGIYLDTDVEVIRSLDKFLCLDGFSGFSEVIKGDFQIPAAVMGSKKHNSYIKCLLSYYDKRHFYSNDGKMDLKANVTIITEMTSEKYPQFKFNNSFQEIPSYTYYPHDFFTPSFRHHNHGPIITKNTYAIHYHNESWMPLFTRLRIKLLIILSYLNLKVPIRGAYWRIFRKK